MAKRAHRVRNTTSGASVRRAANMVFLVRPSTLGSMPEKNETAEVSVDTAAGPASTYFTGWPATAASSVWPWTCPHCNTLFSLAPARTFLPSAPLRRSSDTGVPMSEWLASSELSDLLAVAGQTGNGGKLLADAYAGQRPDRLPTLAAQRSSSAMVSARPRRTWLSGSASSTGSSVPACSASRNPIIHCNDKLFGRKLQVGSPQSDAYKLKQQAGKAIASFKKWRRSMQMRAIHEKSRSNGSNAQAANQPSPVI